MYKDIFDLKGTVYYPAQLRFIITVNQVEIVFWYRMFSIKHFYCNFVNVRRPTNFDDFRPRRCPIIIKIGVVQKVYEIKLSFCQNYPLIGESFWQNTSLVTHMLLELPMLILIFSTNDYGTPSSIVKQE